MDYRNEMIKYIQNEIGTLKKMDMNSLNNILNILEEARLGNRNIFVCGNGGSAATSNHFVLDFNKGIGEKLGKNMYRVISLCESTEMITAIANDIKFEDVFLYQIVGKIFEGDVLIGISTSGESVNIVKAMEYVKKKGGVTIALSGASENSLVKLADYSMCVQSDSVRICEDIHGIINHMMIHALIGELRIKNEEN